MSTRRLPSLVVSLLLAAGACPAGDIKKADNTSSLNTTASWVGGVVPGAADTMVVDSTLTTSRTAALGGNLSILGINHTATQQLQISNTAGATLTIGSGGISKTGTGTLIFANNVALGSAQTWNIGSGSLQFATTPNTFSDAGHALSITGAGILDLRSSQTFGSNVTIGTNITVNSATATVAFGGANTGDKFFLAAGTARVSTLGNFGAASAAGDGGTSITIDLGSANASAVFEYTGGTASSDRTFNLDRRSNGASLLVTTAGQTLTLTGGISTSLGNATGEKDVTLTAGGEGNLVLGGAVLDHSSASFVTGLTKTGTGTLALTATNAYAGTTTISAGTLALGNGGTTGRIATASSIVNNGTFAVKRSDAVTQGTDFSAAAITGTGAFLQTGSGVTTLNAANTFSGKTTVAAGTLAFTAGAAGATDAQPLGTNAALDLGVAGQSSGTLEYTGSGAATLAKDIKSLGNGSDRIRNAGTGLLTLSGGLIKNGTVLALGGGAGGITVSGAISGSAAGSDLVVDSGTVTLTGTNTYNGPTIIRNGATLRADAAQALPTANGRSAVVLDDSGSGSSTLALGASQAVAALTGAATSKVDLGAHTLTVGRASGDSTFAGTVSGTGQLVKDGASALALTGANTFTGDVTIHAGTVTLGASGALADISDLVLQGGTIRTLASVSDTLATLDLNASSTIDVGLGSSLYFAKSDTVSWAAGATLTLAGSFVNNSSLRFGTDSTGLTSTQLSSIVHLGGLSSFQLDSGGYLFAAVPEPSTYALLALGGGLCLVFHRRRRRA